MTYFLQGFGVFLGVIAGTAVTLLAVWIVRWHDAKNRKANLVFELEMNIAKIERWLEALAELRNAVNGDSVDTYFGYFDFSRFVGLTAYSMFQSGELYKHLSHDQIAQLQALGSEYSQAGEQYINNQFAQHRYFFEQSRANDGLSSWLTTGKAQAVRDVNFWERKFKQHIESLRGIVTTLRGEAKVNA